MHFIPCFSNLINLGSFINFSQNGYKDQNIFNFKDDPSFVFPRAYGFIVCIWFPILEGLRAYNTFAKAA